MDEHWLIQSAQKGDIEAFNRLVLAYQDMVYTHTYRMLGDEAEADDATQETFISAYRALSTFRGGSFRAWLLRIASNQCYDELRRQKRRPTTSLEPVTSEEDELESVKWLVDPGDTPEEVATKKALSEAIQNCLDELPVDFRSVVALVDIQGLDYQEAALALAVPVGTIKSRLARARLRLQGCLQGFWELLPSRFRLVGEERG